MLDPLVGMFVNTLVLRASVEIDQSFTDLLAHVVTSTWRHSGTRSSHSRRSSMPSTRCAPRPSRPLLRSS